MILKTWGPEEDQVGAGVFSRCMSFSLDFFFFKFNYCCAPLVEMAIQIH